MSKQARGSLYGLLARFTGVGMFLTLLYAIAVAILVEFFSVEAIWASVLGYLIAIPVSFYGHRNITFRSNGHVNSEFVRFLVVHGTGLIISFYSMSLATKTFALPYWVGMIIVAVLVALMSFIIMNSWVFSSKKSD